MPRPRQAPLARYQGSHCLFRAQDGVAAGGRNGAYAAVDPVDLAAAVHPDDERAIGEPAEIARVNDGPAQDLLSDTTARQAFGDCLPDLRASQATRLRQQPGPVHEILGYRGRLRIRRGLLAVRVRALASKRHHMGAVIRQKHIQVAQARRCDLPDGCAVLISHSVRHRRVPLSRDRNAHPLCQIAHEVSRGRPMHDAVDHHFARGVHARRVEHLLGA